MAQTAIIKRGHYWSSHWPDSLYCIIVHLSGCYMISLLWLEYMRTKQQARIPLPILSADIMEFFGHEILPRWFQKNTNQGMV